MATRQGLRIRGHRGHPEVRAACVRYAVWLRKHFQFPIRVPVYLLPGEEVIAMHGEACTASFFAPWDQSVEPYIRLATGDYPELLKQYGRDNALAMYLSSLSHEVIHYQQWVETGKTWERGVANRGVAMVERYAKTVDHP